MLPGPEISDEDFLKISQDLARFALSLAKGNRKSVFLTAKVLAIGAIGGAIIGALVALGQSYAIGLHPSWETYRNWWMLSPLFGVCVPIAYFLLSLAFFNGSLLIERAYKATFTDRTQRILGKVGLVLLFSTLVVSLLLVPVFLAYESARESNALLAGSDLDNLTSVQTVVNTQTKMLSDLSVRGEDILGQFDKMVKVFQGTRNDLSKTIENLNTQIAEGKHATQEVSMLLERQRQIELRITELQRLLDGGTPITKQDLESAGRTSLVFGAILGFCASLVAAFSYSWFVRFLRRFKEGKLHAS